MSAALAKGHALGARRRRPRSRSDAQLEKAVAGQRIVVTGASSGIGRALALRLGRAGGQLGLIARRQDELEHVAGQIASAGGRAQVWPADLAAPGQAEAAATKILGELGGVDLLVNNAGFSIRRPIARSCRRQRDLERTINLNYYGAMGLIRSVLPGMCDRGHGHIINVSSAGTQNNTPLFAAYNASKSALDAWSRTAAGELAGSGVRMTTVYMPLVDTAMTADTRAYDGSRLPTAEDGAELVVRAIVTRAARVAPGLATVGEIASAVSPGGHQRFMGLLHRRVPALEALMLWPHTAMSTMRRTGRARARRRS